MRIQLTVEDSDLQSMGSIDAIIISLESVGWTVMHDRDLMRRCDHFVFLKGENVSDTLYRTDDVVQMEYHTEYEDIMTLGNGTVNRVQTFRDFRIPEYFITSGTIYECVRSYERLMISGPPTPDTNPPNVAVPIMGKQRLGKHRIIVMETV